MSVLDRVERRLEVLVERLFARAFRGPVHPIDIARALARTLDEHATPSVARTYVPNRFRVRMNPHDVEPLTGIATLLREELEAYVQEQAAHRGYVLAGHGEVEIQASEEIKAGSIQVTAQFDPGPVDAGPSSEKPPDEGKTRIFQISTLRPARLEVVEGSQTGARFILVSEVVVGRSSDCGAMIDDPAVSREHLRITPAADGYLLIDQHSTNGTLVNGTPTTRRLLRPGDRIQLGATVLEFRIDGE